MSHKMTPGLYGLTASVLCLAGTDSVGLWQDNMLISAFSNVQKQYLVVQRQFMPQIVVHGGTKLERQNH